ncbi:DUF659 family protein [Rhizoctonia solani AG-3 Rhs1AP]|uniref:DUF659 family protein n=2 Tax=Rhizoctonia solani AG-3 TaxID=1086053 RepID=A0A074RG60_9AGAM|nr:DUF659 family protein [Rhizoctonia solani AG-3 Rhs1AP]KEP46126.1 DUF659 family protein [Rhizoctonia solani 123E]
MLENTIGLRATGLELRERGSGIIAVVRVLDGGLTECPESAILAKWLDDLIALAQSAGAVLKPVDRKRNASNLTSMKLSTPATRFGINKMDSQWADPRYTDVNEESIDRSKGGAIPDPYIIAATVPCYRVDDDERAAKLVRWKELFTDANPLYEPACASTIRDIQIPETAAYIRGKQLDYLRTQFSLTLSFDGGSNRRSQSFYTVHVTTMDRQIFLLCADYAPRTSHNAQYIYKLLKAQIVKIGTERFAAVISDNASNMRAGRALVADEFPNILNLQDAVHHLHNTCKDLCGLPAFAKVIDITRSVIRFFSHSADATAHVQFIMPEYKITCWLQKIGGTSFATIYYSCKSLFECLPAIASAVDRKLIKLSSMELTNIVALLEPCAKSIKCLESSHSTPATVMKFWVATLGCCEDLLKSAEFKRMPRDLIESIRLTLNRRFKAMINNAPLDCYLASLFLVPDYRGALAIDEPNPLAATFVIRPCHASSSSSPLNSLKEVNTHSNWRLYMWNFVKQRIFAW